MYVCMFYVRLALCLSVCRAHFGTHPLSLGVPVCLYVCMYVCLYVCLYVRSSICLSVCLFGARPKRTQRESVGFALDLVRQSMGSTLTRQYDNFQWLTNGILP